MAYNLGAPFKNILKIISLGVLLSLNVMSDDVFAMDDEEDDDFREALALSLRGYNDDELMIALAISRDDAERVNGEVAAAPKEGGAASIVRAAVPDLGRESPDAAQSSYVFVWDQANLQQRELLFKFCDSVSIVKTSLETIVGAWNMLMLEGSIDDPKLTADICGYDKEVLGAKQQISKIVEAFQENLTQFYQQNRTHIGDHREALITDQIKRFSQELKNIFDPFNVLFTSKEAFLAVLSSRENLVRCGDVFREADNRLKQSFLTGPSEKLRGLLYAEYGSQPTEDQKRAMKKAAGQAPEDLRKAAEIERAQKEAERRARIASFQKDFTEFFDKFIGHFQEKMAQMVVNKGGQGEAVMVFFGRDSLQLLGDLLDKKDGILERVSLSFYGIQSGQIADTFLKEQEFNKFVERTEIRRTPDFEGGLATIGRYNFILNEFEKMSPKDAFLKPLALLKELHGKFPKDERVQTAVAGAFSLIEDQNKKCPAGLLGRSFMLSQIVLGLLREGVEKPFGE